MLLEYKTTSNDENKSVKAILQNEFQISNRFMTKLKLQQKILVNNEPVWVNYIPPKNAVIQVLIDFEEEDSVLPQKGNLEIIYEDEYFLAVNKIANMVVHPCSYHPDGTLANYVKEYLNNKKKIRPINRLDNGTSGIVLFAKNEYIQELFKNMEIQPKKEYITLTWGEFKEKQGTISAPIARKKESIMEREVNFEEGQEAVTHYEVIREAQLDQTAVSLVRVFLETGRTHQIRVHMTYKNHPLVGDSLYGNVSLPDNIKLDRQALHAYRLSFIHPITKKEMILLAPIPDDMNNVIQSCFSTENINF